MATFELKNDLSENIAMSRIVIPTIIRDMPTKYLIAVNFGNEEATKTPVAIENTITIHIILNEF